MVTKRKKQKASGSDDTRNNRFFVVALGASAGGLESLKNIFSNMPRESGMAFVVITHQKPGYISLLPEILSKSTTIPIKPAENGEMLQPNHIYTNTSNGLLSVSREGKFLTVDAPTSPDEGDAYFHPIDHFYRSLADAWHSKAVAIVLSGTGSDGAIGIQTIKEQEGMAIAEDPKLAGFAGMPLSAIHTSMVDYILAAEEMPKALVDFTNTSTKNQIAFGKELTQVSTETLDRIFVLLRVRTGHDFSSYKPNTLQRRILRRMNIHQITKPGEYLEFLKVNPQEVDLLFKEMLIRVTRFFRDPEVWEALAAGAIVQLLQSKQRVDPIRIWVPACATGEEAYSLAILLKEQMQVLNIYHDVQIFATDLDSGAIDLARKGSYPEGISSDVSASRLKKFFTLADGYYLVRKDIREMMIFAPQNLINDPPFTRVDFISCRNFLIYIQSELQAKLFALFHYALKPKGILLLGLSESIGEFTSLFEPVDKSHKIFQRKDVIKPYKLLPDFSSRTTPLTNSEAQGAEILTRPNLDKASFSTTILRMLTTRFAPTCIITNSLGEIFYIHGKTGTYLEPNEGLPAHNLLQMARDGLRLELSTALHQVSRDEHAVVVKLVRVKSIIGYITVKLTAEKIQTPETMRGLMLVTFATNEDDATTKVEQPPSQKNQSEQESDSTRSRLEAELQMAQESYQTIVEELESSNEELKSTNEELQSTNEELETSKEEMQSLNEELSTVNNELQLKLDALALSNNDMQNLLNSSDIATIFLDQHLCIKRYTEQATQLISIRPTDIGRPVHELHSQLKYNQLVEDARAVLKTLIPKEIKVVTDNDDWYQMRILPYRTTNNAINGLVCTFVNISNLQRAEDSGAYFSGIVDILPLPVAVLDKHFRLYSANQAFFDFMKVKNENAIGKSIFSLSDEALNIDVIRSHLKNLASTRKTFDNLSLELDQPAFGKVSLSLSGSLFSPSEDELYLLFFSLKK